MSDMLVLVAVSLSRPSEKYLGKAVSSSPWHGLLSLISNSNWVITLRC